MKCNHSDVGLTRNTPSPVLSNWHDLTYHSSWIQWGNKGGHNREDLTTWSLQWHRQHLAGVVRRALAPQPHPLHPPWTWGLLAAQAAQ